MKIFKSFILILILLVSSSLLASDLGIGISAWYADWKMEIPDGSTRKMDSVFYIGPSVSYQYAQSWSTTLVALLTPSPYEMANENDGTTDVKRYDVDLALNYQIIRYVKVFCGAKYLGFTFEGGRHHGAGPGGGIGMTLPVMGNFYFLGNASGLYLWGNHKDNNSNKDFIEYGYNLSAQLAYYLASFGITTSIGYRYQFMKSKYDTNDPSGKEDVHTFKGVTLQIVKSFHWE